MQPFASVPHSVSNEISPTAMVAGLPGHCAVIDRHGTIVVVNEAWREFARTNGYRGNDFGIGTSYLDACGAARSKRSRFAIEAARVLSGVLSGEMDCGGFDYPCHAPSEKRWFRMTVMPCTLAAQRGAIVMHLDVTAECEKREAQARILQRLRAAGSTRNDLAGIIHDIKSPLHALAGMTDFLLHDLAGPTTSKQREYLTQMLTACERACSMIDSQVSGLFNESDVPGNDVCEVREVLSDVVGLLTAEAEGNGVTIALDVGEALPGLAIPAVELSRMVSNLLTNAIRYAGKGAKATVSAKYAGDELLIAVADDGIGIPTEELGELMQPRRRGRSAKASGTGLGLSVMRNIVSGYGGGVRMKSAPGEGLCVTISFGDTTIVPLSRMQAA